MNHSNIYALFYGTTSHIPVLLTDKEDFTILTLKAKISIIHSKRSSEKRFM